MLFVQVILLLWCLMESKTEAAYISVFLFLRNRLGHWIVDQAKCDFEDAMINAFRLVFGIQVLVCYLHYVNVGIQCFQHHRMNTKK